MNRAEWAKIPTVAPYTWAIRRNGVIERAELDVFGVESKLENLPPAPFDLVAIPHRENLPEIAMTIEPGDTPIWLHCRRQVYPMDLGTLHTLEPMLFEYPLIGRRLPDGREWVWAIYPDGQTALFNSINEAAA